MRPQHIVGGGATGISPFRRIRETTLFFCRSGPLRRESPMGVTNIWHVMNLTSTPFFQDPLSPWENAQHPINLFVNREKEARYIRDGIGSSQHSRYVIQGAVGVGKTTLLQYVKVEAAKAGYLLDSDAVS